MLCFDDDSNGFVVFTGTDLLGLHDLKLFSKKQKLFLVTKKFINYFKHYLPIFKKSR